MKHQIMCKLNLGASLDSKLNMEKQVNYISRSCFPQLRQKSRIRKYLTDATKSLEYYCNSLLIGVPKIVLNKLQKVQNTAARLITKTSRYNHITPILKQLHWLPVQYRTKFKILTHVQSLQDQFSTYVKQFLNVYKPNRTFKIQRTSDIIVPISYILSSQLHDNCSETVE